MLCALAGDVDALLTISLLCLNKPLPRHHLKVELVYSVNLVSIFYTVLVPSLVYTKKNNLVQSFVEHMHLYFL